MLAIHDFYERPFINFVTLTRLISISLLMVMLVVQTPVLQLLKVSVLIEHYYEHKNLDERMGVLEFLSMHYAKGSVKDADHARDMQLPFKQCHAVSLVFTFFEQKSMFELQTKPAFIIVNKQLSQYNSPYHSSAALSNIWQPPRA